MMQRGQNVLRRYNAYHDHGLFPMKAAGRTACVRHSPGATILLPEIFTLGFRIPDAGAKRAGHGSPGQGDLPWRSPHGTQDLFPVENTGSADYANANLGRKINRITSKEDPIIAGRFLGFTSR